jgi:hypothetical protein
VKYVQFNSGLASPTWSFEPGEIAAWPSDEEAQRFEQRRIATILTEDAAVAAGRASGRGIRKHVVESINPTK